jgi:hypothetical protein
MQPRSYLPTQIATHRLPYRDQQCDPVSAADAFILSVLKGEQLAFPSPADDAFADALMARSSLHGITALLHYNCVKNATLQSWPAALSERLSKLVEAQAAKELAIRRHLAILIEALASAGVSALLVKGTPLAYTHYPEAYLRTRCDTDILIPEHDRNRTHDILIAIGYRMHRSYARKYASYQINYSQEILGPIISVIDLHWRISNREGFATCFSFGELYDASTPLPKLATGALGLNPIHAMTLACLHRATHIAAPYTVSGQRYYEANRLIWLYDIFLLSASFSNNQWDEFASIAHEKKIRAVCWDAIKATQDLLAAPVPVRIREGLADSTQSEASARYLKPGYWRSHMIADLHAAPTVMHRLHLLSEWVLPPTAYILEQYNTRNLWLLPLLYVHRAFTAIPKLLSRSENSSR